MKSNLDTNQKFYFSLQIFDPEKSQRESFRLVNRVEPSFVIQGRSYSRKSQFLVFAQNPVGLSQGVTISASLIIGMKQGGHIAQGLRNWERRVRN